MPLGYSEPRARRPWPHLPLCHDRGLAYDAVVCRSGRFLPREVALMRLVLWAAFFVVCNILGVETFKAALTLPMDEAFVPGVLSIPLIGLTAFGVTRVVGAW